MNVSNRDRRIAHENFQDFGLNVVCSAWGKFASCWILTIVRARIPMRVHIAGLGVARGLNGIAIRSSSKINSRSYCCRKGCIEHKQTIASQPTCAFSPHFCTIIEIDRSLSQHDQYLQQCECRFLGPDGWDKVLSSWLFLECMLCRPT